MRDGVVATLIRSGEPSIRWKVRQVYYKWQGSHWVLAALAGLGYPEGDQTLFPMRDRVVGFWTGPAYFHVFHAATRGAAYPERGVPIMNGRYRRCGSQQGSALRSVMALGIADERADIVGGATRKHSGDDSRVAGAILICQLT
jgi:hypothetical protein